MGYFVAIISELRHPCENLGEEAVMTRMMIAGLLLVATPTFAQTPGALDLPLSIDLARAAVDACAAKGLPVSASVVDDKGNPLVVLRSPASQKPPIAAPRKAATAVQFDAPGSEMEPRQKADPAFAALIAAEPDRLNPHGGSLPLHIDGKLVGGLAVADTTHEAADACARVALAKFGDRLN